MYSNEQTFQEVQAESKEMNSQVLDIVGLFFGMAFCFLVVVALFAVFYRRAKLGTTGLALERKYVDKLCEQEGYEPKPPPYKKSQSRANQSITLNFT